MIDKEALNRLVELISKSAEITIVSHFNPDGDAVGSSIGFFHFLKSLGKKVNVMLPSRMSENVMFLNPQQHPVHIYSDETELGNEIINSSDLIICIDMNAMNRTDTLEQVLLTSKAKKVLVDHHLTPAVEQFDLVFSKIDISSASELLFWILMEMPQMGGDIENLSLECATALYTGMMTDTNNFSNSVFPSTFEMASRLIARGVNKTAIQETVLSSFSEKRMRLMGYVLKCKMRYMPGLNAAMITLSQSEKAKYGFQVGDSEGFVNLPLSIKGVNVSAFFSESFSNDRTYVKVSLRSKGDFDVNRFATKYFNGGGHKNASGGKLYMPLRFVPKYFTRSLKSYLAELKDNGSEE